MSITRNLGKLILRLLGIQFLRYALSGRESAQVGLNLTKSGLDALLFTDTIQPTPSAVVDLTRAAMTATGNLSSLSPLLLQHNHIHRLSLYRLVESRDIVLFQGIKTFQLLIDLSGQLRFHLKLLLRRREIAHGNQ